MATTVRYILIALLMLPNISVAQPMHSAVDADIARYLSAVKFATFLKDGIRDSQKGQAHTSKLTLKVLNLPNSRIIAAVIPIFKHEINPADAKGIADFYSSSTGQAVVSQELAQPGSGKPYVALTVAQRLDVMRFAASPAGQAVRRLNQFERTKDFMHQVFLAVTAVAKQ